MAFNYIQPLINIYQLLNTKIGDKISLSMTFCIIIYASLRKNLTKIVIYLYNFNF